MPNGFCDANNEELFRGEHTSCVLIWSLECEFRQFPSPEDIILNDQSLKHMAYYSWHCFMPDIFRSLIPKRYRVLIHF